jgi:hypothetical protein
MYLNQKDVAQVLAAPLAITGVCASLADAQSLR